MGRLTRRLALIITGCLLAGAGPAFASGPFNAQSLAVSPAAQAASLSAPEATLPSISLPPLGPYVDWARVTYTDSASSYDSKLQLIVVQASSTAKAYIAQLRAEDPGIKVLAYQSPWLRPGSDPSGDTTCLAGSGSYPSNWYMTSSAGQREVWSRPTTTYQMDFANSAYLAACAQHAIAIAKSIGADGIFLDGVAGSVYWGELPTKCATVAQGASATCTSDGAWQNAMTSALTYLSGQLHAQNLLLVGNVSGGNVSGIGNAGPAVWDRYDSAMDGAMEESWTYGTNHQPLPTSEVQNGLANVAWAEAHGKYSILNDDITNCANCSGYGMATLMLVGQGHTSYDLSSGSYTTYTGWWSSYDKGQGLGVSLGSYSTQSNGLLVRHFLNGTIVVNDTAGAITDLLYGTVPAYSATIH